MRERDIFIEALQRDVPAEVEAYLTSACAGDAELRRRVDRLLAEHRRQESFVLDSPPPGLGSPAGVTLEPPSSAPAARLGTQIGPYKLLEQIGEGGMGNVFLAQQTRPVRRQVALKIVKAGMDTAQVAARFEAERQALALMDHPNIAKVFDAGVTDAGGPFFAMELVKGLPITRYCDEHRLTPRQRLELFVPVCHAVQHAHQKGIIHRDLKPNNVLVALYDGKPVPKVIDFGIAKALGQQLTERTMFTGFGAVVGTPEYMSPEQAELNQLDVDTRSDVYALGVLLYELLTGTTPLEHKRVKEAALLEVLRVIREEEPPKPSTRLSTVAELASIAANRGLEPKKLSGLVHGELDWIVMKALEKDRTRRYETANGFARDIERYLHDEPVHACPPSASYRFRKFARRNKRSLAAITAVAIALLLGTVVSTAGFVQANRQRTLAQQNEKRAQQNEARALTEAAKATAVSDLLQEMLASANPDETKGLEYTVRQLLDDFSRGLDQQLHGQPEVEAAVRATIGNAYRRLSITDKAEPHLRRALEIRRKIAATQPAAQEAVADSLLDYGWNLFMATKDAERHLREAAAIYRASPGCEGKLIAALATLQLCLNEFPRYEEAEAVVNEALAVGRRRFPEGHGELANILHRLADSKNVQRDLDAAEALGRQALAMHERWHGDKHPETAWSLGILANICAERGRLEEAESLLRRALAIFRTHYDSSHGSVRRVTSDLMSVLVRRGDQAAVDQLAAETMSHTARSIQSAPENAELWVAVATAQAQLKQWAQAAENCEKAFVVAARSTERTRREVLNGCDAVAAKLREAQRHAEASLVLERAAALAETLAPDIAPNVRLAQANRYNDLAFCLLPMGQTKEAEVAVRKAVELKRALASEFPQNPEYRLHLAHSYRGLNLVLERAERRPEAQQALRDASEVLEVLADDPNAHEGLQKEVGHLLWDIGHRFLDLSAYPQAESLFRVALRTFQRLEVSNPSEPYYRQEQAFSHRTLAVVMEKVGKTHEAWNYYMTARSIYAALAAQDPQQPFYRMEEAFTASCIAAVLTRAGRRDEGIAASREAVALHEKVAVDFPNHPEIRERALRIRREWVELSLEAGTYEEASALADPSFAPAEWRDSYASASVLARAIVAAESDGRISHERRAALTAAWRPHVARLLTSAAKQCPAEPGPLNALAWWLAVNPNPIMRDPRAAIEIAAKAVALDPRDGRIRNTLGVARYRAGEYQQAIADLEKAAELRNDNGSFDFFFLAMANWQLGHHDQARDWYAKAVAWMEKNQPADEELIRFRAEAQELLDVTKDESSP